MTMKAVAQRKRRKKEHVALGLGPTLKKKGREVPDRKRVVEYEIKFKWISSYNSPGR
jgi:hypothetical protein